MYTKFQRRKTCVLISLQGAAPQLAQNGPGAQGRGESTLLGGRMLGEGGLG